MSIKIGDFDQINSESMKIVLAYYFRYILHYKYICTEFKFMDVFVSNGENSTEIECKTSKQDLKNEIKNKKAKHKLYSGKQLTSKFIPNKYYICMTPELYSDPEATKIVNKINNKYGIIIIYPNDPMPYVVKEAQNLNNKKITKNIINKVVERLSSENISLRMKIYEIKNKK